MPQDEHRDRLLAIIDTQNEVVSSELEINAVMDLVAERARALTGADAATIELADGDETICVAVAGTEPEAGTVLCAPLHGGAGELGTLKAYSASPRSFGTADEQTLELLAGLVAAHLSQANRIDGGWSDDSHDPVTQLANRRAYEQRLALEAERARRYRYPLALVIVELEGLAALYERLGERAGDDAVREVAALLNGSRFADEAFRIAEGEFAVLLPHTDLAGAEAAAARLVMQISAGGVVSASWGAASGEGDPAALEERAAQQLGGARDNGRYASAG